MKKIIYILFVIILCFTQQVGTMYALDVIPDDTNYHIVNITNDGSYELIDTYDTYAQASDFYTLQQVNYANLAITYGATFISIEYGVVAFQTSDCSVNTTYTMDSNQAQGYTNGCYGGDAAFLEYNPTNQMVKFMLSGVVGWVSLDSIVIYPYETLPSVSSFLVEDNTLYHQIKQDAMDETYANQLSLGTAIEALKENTTYYSYDTHYFYDTYTSMIDDYRRGGHDKAVNGNAPYYNYYQFITHRSTSSYTLEDINTYLNEKRMLTSYMTSFSDMNTSISAMLTQSMLLQGRVAFLQYQNQFGINAMMMLSLSMNETGSGRSKLAFTRNNLFGHAAFDSSVEESASRYQSVQASVYSHALRYMNDSYLNPDSFTYHGGAFGNKAGGMNVSYASDPYWGEKAAQYYQEIDAQLGKKDLNQYAYGIGNTSSIEIKDQASKDGKTLYSTPDGYEVSFILLEKITNTEGTWYRIQTDPSYDQNHQLVEDGYDFTTSVGYIPASALAAVLNANQQEQKTYVDITFDAAGGTFYPQHNAITLQVENGLLPVVDTPTKDHALFDGWEETLTPAIETKTYHATYKEVSDIVLKEKPKTSYTTGDLLHLDQGLIEIQFQDGTREDITITTDMVTGYDTTILGEQELTITYAGVSIPFTITIQEEDPMITDLQNKADEFLQIYQDHQEFTEEEIATLKSFMDNLIDYDEQVLSITQRMQVETILQTQFPYSVVINDNTYDLQVSALHSAIKDSEDWLSDYIPRTLVITLNNDVDNHIKTLFEQVANANGMRLDDSFCIVGNDNLSTYTLHNTVRYSIQKPEDEMNRLYRVYQYIDGDVQSIPTTQSNGRIQFYTDSTQPFALVSIATTNPNTDEDPIENYTIASNGTDYIGMYLRLPLYLLFIGIGCGLWYAHSRHKKTIKQMNHTHNEKIACDPEENTLQ